MDCLEHMKATESNFYDIAIADPPYGLDKKSTQGAGRLRNRTLNKHDMTWDVRPPMSFFKELRRISKHVIIWGGQLLRPWSVQMLCLLGQTANMAKFLTM